MLIPMSRLSPPSESNATRRVELVMYVLLSSCVASTSVSDVESVAGLFSYCTFRGNIDLFSVFLVRMTAWWVTGMVGELIPGPYLVWSALSP